MIVTTKNGTQIIKVYFINFNKNTLELFVEGNDIPKKINIDEVQTIC